MEFRILGNLEVADNGTMLPLGGPRDQKLLAMLLLSPNRAVQVPRLVEALWEDDPPVTAGKQILNSVSRLRKVLGGARLAGSSSCGFRLHVAEGELDAAVFQATVGQAGCAARGGRLAESAGMLGSALSLWRGPALSGIDSRAVAVRAAAWDEERLAAMDAFYDHRLALGQHHEVTGELTGVVAEHPLHEKSTAQLMLALYRSGCAPEALDAYLRARSILAEQLGLDPGPELQRLHQAILSGDPALAVRHAIPVPADVGTVTRGTSPSVVPRQLPAVVRPFVGRTDQLKLMTAMCDEAVAGVFVITVIQGTPGIGKTSLAVHWAHQVAGQFPDGQLYVNLRGYDPDQPAPATDTLAGFLRALGVAGQDIPAEEAERAALYRSLLAGKRMLVILDNAGSAEQVRPLLPGTPSCAVTVTSRDALAGLVALDGARRLDLGPLPLDDAVAVLRELIGARVDADTRAAAELATQCARLPLALRVAAELAAARPWIPLTELNRELADLQRRLDLLDASGDPRTAVRTVFSWSCRHLDADAARAFRLLGLHPGLDFDPYAAAALTGSTVTEARRMLDVLVRANLIQPAAAHRYGLHDLLRAYARELAAKDGEPEQRSALTRLFDHYLHAAATAMNALFPADRLHRPSVPVPATPVAPLTDPAAARTWLDAERSTLVAVAQHMAGSGWPGHATRLAATLSYDLDICGHHPEATIIHGQARMAARQLGDRAAEATALLALGWVALGQGDCRKASDCFQEALPLYRATGDLTGQARAVNGLGLADHQEGRYVLGSSRFLESLALYRETGDRRGQAIALSNLGCSNSRQGRYQDSLSCHEQSLAIFRDVSDRDGEALALTRLGGLGVRMGRYRQAIENLHRGLAIFRDIGDRDGQASALNWLSTARRELGQPQQAVEHAEQALALFLDLGDKAGQSNALNCLGEALLASGQPGQARHQHAAALALASETCDQHQRSRAHAGLGAACSAVGDIGEACGHWRQALALYTALGSPEAGRVRAYLTKAASAQQAVSELEFG